MQSLSRIMVILALGVAVLLPGCSDDAVSSRLPEVVNVKDRFHLRMEDVKNHDTLLVYYWPMDGTSANIDQAATIKGGRVSIIVEDNSQVTVYQTDMRQNGSFTTTLGASGFWRIRATLTDFSGMFDFRAQRR
jgi:hypothetical protein